MPNSSTYYRVPVSQKRVFCQLKCTQLQKQMVMGSGVDGLQDNNFTIFNEVFYVFCYLYALKRLLRGSKFRQLVTESKIDLFTWQNNIFNSDIPVKIYLSLNIPKNVLTL